MPGQRVTRDAGRRPSPLGQLAGGAERLVVATGGEQQADPALAVELQVVGHRREGRRLLQVAIGRLQPALVLVAAAEQVEVVRVVPVHAGRDVLGQVVRLLDLVRPGESGDRVLHAAHAPQVVAVHVVRVRDPGSEAGVGRSVLQGQVDLVDGLVGMDEIVVGREVVGEDGEGLPVEGDRGGPAPLPASRGRGLLGVASQAPELGVGEVDGQRVVERLLVREVLVHAGQIVEGIELLRTKRDPTLLPRTGLGGAFLRLRLRIPRGGRILQAREGPREPDPAEGQVGIVAEGLVEGSRGLHPDVRMKIGEALVVERLGLLRRGGHGVVGVADARSKRHRTLQDLPGHPADRPAGRVGIVLGQGRGREQQRDQGLANPGGLLVAGEHGHRHQLLKREGASTS